MTTEEIIEALTTGKGILTSKGDTWMDDSDFEPDEFIYVRRNDSPLTLHGQEISLVTQVGGEGEGETYYVVVQVGDQYFRADAYYNSWIGTDWYSEPTWREVFPVERVVVEYK